MTVTKWMDLSWCIDYILYKKVKFRLHSLFLKFKLLSLFLKFKLHSLFFRPFLQEEQVGPLKVRVIVTNGVSSLEKCTLDRRSEEIG